MGFFVLPDPIEPDEVEDEYEGPAPWIGTAVPMNVLVAKTDAAAIVLRDLVVFRDSFDFTILSYIRNPTDDDGYFGPVAWHGSRGHDERFLRIGLSWSDGGRATNIDEWEPWPDATEPEHWLSESRGGGSGDTYMQSLRAGPVPVGGVTLQLVVEWPAHGIEDTYVDFPVARMAEGAALAQPVWPEDADRPISHMHTPHWRTHFAAVRIEATDDEVDG